MNTLEIKGKYGTALCYAKVIEDAAVEQIRRMCDYDFTENSQIRIMPDVHAGKGCTIGTSSMSIKAELTTPLFLTRLYSRCVSSSVARLNTTPPHSTS